MEMNVKKPRHVIGYIWYFSWTQTG